MGPKPKSIVSIEKAKSILDSYDGIEYGCSLEFLKPIMDLHKKLLEEDLHLFESRNNVISFGDFLAQKHCPVFLDAMCKLLVKRAGVPINFSATKYLYIHQDVAKSGLDPYEHYLRFGRSEGRLV